MEWVKIKIKWTQESLTEVKMTRTIIGNKKPLKQSQKTHMAP